MVNKIYILLFILLICAEMLSLYVEYRAQAVGHTLNVADMFKGTCQ